MGRTASIHKAKHLEIMPLGLSPSARLILLALWFLEASNISSTRNQISSVSGVYDVSFSRALRELRSHGLISTVRL